MNKNLENLRKTVETILRCDLANAIGIPDEAEAENLIERFLYAIAERIGGNALERWINPQWVILAAGKGTRIDPSSRLKDWVEVPPDAPNQDPFECANTEGRRFTGELLGEGILDLPAAIRELKQLDYQGYVSIEYEGHKEPRDATRQGVEYVRSLLEM